MSVIASQIAGKAARDAIFLSTYDITDLPFMLMAASAMSIFMVLGVARLIRSMGPSRLIPLSFLTSSLTLLGIWGILHLAPNAAAILLYLHVTAFGVVLISGFWSAVNERFDPYTAKKTISRVVGGATFGGLIGGVLAERLAAFADVSVILPVVAGLHLVCAWKVRDLAPVAGRSRIRSTEDRSRRSSWQILRRESYLRNLAIVVITGTVAAAILDYVYKSYATGRFGGAEDLTRFFAWYYMGVGILTFLVQSLLSRRSLEKMGLAGTIAMLPFVTAAGSLSAIFMPNLITATAARFSEAVFRNSLFRSGYELFFVPVPEQEKRATKTIIDVGFDRLGDAVGGGLIKLVLLAAPLLATRILLAVAVGLACLGLIVSVFLKRGYVRALEKNLLSRDVGLDAPMAGDASTDTMILHTLTNLSIHDISRLEAGQALASGKTGPGEGAAKKVVIDNGGLPGKQEVSAVADPVARQVIELRSGNSDRVKRALSSPARIEPLLAAHVVPLLAWDEVFHHSVKALRKIAPRITGQLSDILMDPAEEFIIRRRIPLVLNACFTQRAADGLMAAMTDKRFEVRFHASKALACVQAGETDVRIGTEWVFDTVSDELKVDRHMWRDRRILDRPDNECGLGFFDEILKDHAEYSLEHVFTLLALVLDHKPLRVAFRGLHTSDDMLRGTALEYLDVILPPAVRDALWPKIGDVGRKAPEPDRDRTQATQNLLLSSQMIDASLLDLNRKT